MQPGFWQEVRYLRTISTSVHTHKRTLAREHTHSVTHNECVCNVCATVRGK